MKPRAAVVARFWNLVTGLTLTEFLQLLKCGTDSPKLYVHNFGEFTARRPEAGEVSWPVEFLLTAFHRKHVFVHVNKPQCRR